MAADTLPHAAVTHTIDGRTRLRVPGRRENEAFFASVTAGLSAIPGVRRVEATPLTASILIFHDAPLARIGEEAEKRGLFSLAAGTTARTPALHIRPRMAAAAGLGAIALWQVYREKLFPSALSVAMHAVNLAGLLPPDDSTSVGD